MGFGKSTRRKHSKLGSTTLRAFHFRIEATPEQNTKLHQHLSIAWELRNYLAITLENNRKEARIAKQNGIEPKYINSFELKKMVAGNQLDDRFCVLHSQVRQDLSMRVIEGQQRWFDAIKEGRSHIRPPSTIDRKKFRSITYPQYGAAAQIKNGKLHLSKLGEFRIIGWRKMRGAKKSITLKFKDGFWWAIVMCQIQQSDQCRPFKEVADLPEAGIDPGLTRVLTDSYGIEYETPKPLKQAQAKLSHIQKDVSRKFEVRKAKHIQHLAAIRLQTGSKAPVSEGLTESLRLIPYSNRLKANIKKLVKAHTKVERIRGDVARKNVRKIEKRYSRVAVEEHGLQFMLSNHKLAKTASDVAIGKQKQALVSAMGAGRVHKASNRRTEGGNSQTCLCGEPVPKTLNDRWHECPECGLQGPRDQVSAIIVQHMAFGSLPQLPSATKIKTSKESTSGLGVLEHAVKVLKTRRGESKSRKGTCSKTASPNGENHATESISAVPTARALELSVKRPTHKAESIRKTTGEAYAAIVEVETMGYVDTLNSCPIETKKRMFNVLLTTENESAIGNSPRSALIYVGE